MMKGVEAEDEELYARHFQDFPDDWASLRKQGLVWIRYTITEGSRRGIKRTSSLEELIEEGVVRCEPIVYEDFLPISAAGIFQSNLKDSSKGSPARPTRFIGRTSGGRIDFEEALGCKVLDEMDLYKAIQEESLVRIWRELDLAPMSRL